MIYLVEFSSLHMILPAHVEALRCRMAASLWKDTCAVGPLPELMSDIMSFIPQPMLTFDCPIEEIIVDVSDKPICIFVEGGVLYAVFSECNTVFLSEIHPAGGSSVLAKAVDGQVMCYYDDSTSHLYVLHRYNNISLVDYDVKGGRVHKTYYMPVFLSAGSWPSCMTVIHGHCFFTATCHGQSEVLYTKLGRGDGDDMYVISSEARTDTETSVAGIFPISLSPLVVNVAYHRELTRRSVEFRMVSESNPVAFVKKEITQLALATPEDVTSSPISGCDVLLCTSGDSYCLRNSRWRKLSKGFEFDKGIPYLLECPGAADNSGRLCFIIDRNTRRDFILNAELGEFRLLRAHPYRR